MSTGATAGRQAGISRNSLEASDLAEQQVGSIHTKKLQEDDLEAGIRQ